MEEQIIIKIGLSEYYPKDVYHAIELLDIYQNKLYQDAKFKSSAGRAKKDDKKTSD